MFIGDLCMLFRALFRSKLGKQKEKIIGKNNRKPCKIAKLAGKFPWESPRMTTILPPFYHQLTTILPGLLPPFYFPM